MKLSTAFDLRDESWRKTRLLFVVGIAVAVTGYLALFVFSGTAHGQGGIGPGGSGGGGGGGHQSIYGYGWSIYAAGPGAPGPTNGFRDGTPWSSVNATCNNAGASEVIMFTVYNASQVAKAYNDLNWWNNWPGGLSRDQGRATSISRNDAQSRFNFLWAHGVSTAGYTFGSNVAWFCWNFENSSCSITAPAAVLPNQTFSITVTVNNTGGTTFHNSGSHPYRLGSWNPHDNNTWGPSRAGLPANIGPGTSRNVTFNVTAPGSPGLRSMTWRTVHEGVKWFGNSCSHNINVINPSLWDYDVNVTPDSSSCQIVRPGETFRVNSLAVNSGNGDGPRYRHRIYTYPGSSRTYGDSYTTTTGGTGGGHDVYGGRTWDNVTALTASGSTDRVTRYIDIYVNSNAPDGIQIYYMADVAGAAGTSSPITTTHSVDTTRDGEGGQYTRCVQVDRAQYNYDPSTPTSYQSPALARYYAGTSFGLRGSVDNVGNANGPNYQQRFYVASGGSNLSSGDSTHAFGTSSGLTPAQAPVNQQTASNRYGISASAPNGSQVCFNNYVTPNYGLGPPLYSVTSASQTSAPPSCVPIYNLRYNIDTYTDTGGSPNVVFSNNSLLPGDAFTVAVNTCNNESVSPATGGAAPNVNTIISPGTNAVGGAVNNTANVARNNCADYVYNGTVNPSSQLGEDVCVQVRVNRDTGFSDGYLAAGSQDRTFCVDVAEQAYLTVNNGSVWAGGDYDPSSRGYGTGWCTVPGGQSNGYIRTAINDTTDTGSFAGYSAGATGDVDQFASGLTAIGPSGGVTGTLNELTFANVPTDGQFSIDGRCITDFWKYLSHNPASSPLISSITTFPPGTNRVGQYVANNNITIGNQTLNANERITLLVDGDVTITGDIQYNYNVNDPSNIPILLVMACGDIDIRDSVREIAGVFMARADDALCSNNSARGIIDTCSDAPADGRLFDGVCRNQLVVNGAFIANDIEFRRTHGGITGGNSNGGLNPAEVFNFSSEMYLASPVLVSDQEQNLPVDFLKDLPPVIY